MQHVHSHPRLERYNLILSSHLRLRVPNFLHFTFSTVILTLVFFATVHATSPDNMALLDLITLLVSAERLKL